MATVRLIIRKNKINKDGKCVIYLKYTHDQDYILFSTGEKVNPDDWDPVTQKVKRTYRGHTSLNDTLDTKVEEVKTIARIAKQNKIDPGLEYVKSMMEKAKPTPAEVKKDFFSVFEEFITHHEHLRAKDTIKHYKTSLRHLQQFSKMSRYKFTFEDIDQKFYDKYIKHLYALNLQNNTVGNEIKYLKTFLSWALQHGYHKKTEYTKFKKPTSQTEIIYLTRGELEAMLTYDLSSNKRLERVRDVFVFECATGLRYSDIVNLKPENIKENRIEFTTVKTRDRLQIPLNTYALQVLARNDGKLPKPVSNQKMNEYLKELGEVCGITENVQRVRFSGGKRIEYKVPKYELMTTHTARRTFVTQSLERGIRPEIIMKITGHKDIKTMMKYVKITDNVIEAELLRAWGDAPAFIKISNRIRIK